MHNFKGSPYELALTMFSCAAQQYLAYFTQDHLTSKCIRTHASDAGENVYAQTAVTPRSGALRGPESSDRQILQRNT